jgi:hypothetical protein
VVTAVALWLVLGVVAALTNDAGHGERRDEQQDEQQDERLDSLWDFKRLCVDQVGNESAAAYRDPAPHPLAFFPFTGDSDFATSGKGAAEPEPKEVQLVACANLIRRVSDTPIAACAYKDHAGSSYYVGYYQGRYQVTVYEARTGRTVGSIRLNGPKNQDCAPEDLVVEGEHITEREVEPSATDYATALSGYVTGSAKR